MSGHVEISIAVVDEVNFGQFWVRGYTQDSSQHFIKPTGHVDLVGQLLKVVEQVIKSDVHSINP